MKKAVSDLNDLYSYLSKELIKRQIRLSNRRLKVLEYLCANLDHPTADQIYIKIKKEEPTLSKTTVYNTLHLLVDTGLVRVVNIEDNEAHYDIVNDSHGHFKCQQCGAITDFDIDLERLSSNALSGFRVIDKSVYFKGICPKCLSNIEINN